MTPGQHTGIATMDAEPARCSARCQCFNVTVGRKCRLGTSQTLSDKISEHPEFGAARGCRPPGQDQGAERLVWRERPNLLVWLGKHPMEVCGRSTHAIGIKLEQPGGRFGG